MNTAHIDLTGRVALVTGASSGIGRDLCLDLARSGAKVIAGARRTDKLETLVEEIRAAGGEAIAVTFDVCDAESIRAAFDEGEAAFGLIDTIYANAGTYVAADALSLSMDDFNHVMQTNLNGTILTAREGAQRLINAGPEHSERGRVVVTSSVRGQFPASNHLAYCTSKAATLMAGKVLAKEWALHGINVNMVCPGVIITDINEWFYDTDDGKNQLASYPRNRAMTIDDLNSMMLFLGSDASRAITGSVVTIDDGQTLR